ncbi:30S ribosome-binding factor RbfA [Anthocerotibacter panamensis]|uniref:30S ribosome-binding factor RbfA n=1 Tax=Anthocerotibacter panamensis TaxID=2857077 RepID=UPI001C403285|nr:30S ribosome-binding factor RbfA [Anthocerotibacter panamensis]
MKTFRTERIGELIRKEVSDMLLRGLKDGRIGSGMVSITEVEVTRDLRQAKIFVSIFGDSQAQEETMAGLNSAAGYVRGEIGRRIRLRYTPEIIFEQDHSLERGDRIMTLLNQLKPPTQAPPSTPI